MGNRLQIPLYYLPPPTHTNVGINLRVLPFFLRGINLLSRNSFLYARLSGIHLGPTQYDGRESRRYLIYQYSIFYAISIRVRYKFQCSESGLKASRIETCRSTEEHARRTAAGGASMRRNPLACGGIYRYAWKH